MILIDALQVKRRPLEGFGNQSKEETMATAKQRTAARRNINKAATAAKRKRTIAHLPKRTRTALGKQAANMARRKRRAS